MVARRDSARARTTYRQAAGAGESGASVITIGLADVAMYEGQYAEAPWSMSRVRTWQPCSSGSRGCRCLAEVVDTDDAWVRDLPREVELALEPRFEIAPFQGRRAGIDANQLQGDRGAEGFIPRVIDRAHAAGSEQPDDVYRPLNCCPGRSTGIPDTGKAVWDTVPLDGHVSSGSKPAADVAGSRAWSAGAGFGVRQTSHLSSAADVVAPQCRQSMFGDA
jgi:hypothetical protein